MFDRFPEEALLKPVAGRVGCPACGMAVASVNRQEESAWADAVTSSLADTPACTEDFHWECSARPDYTAAAAAAVVAVASAPASRASEDASVVGTIVLEPIRSDHNRNCTEVSLHHCDADRGGPCRPAYRTNSYVETVAAAAAVAVDVVAAAGALTSETESDPARPQSDIRPPTSTMANLAPSAVAGRSAGSS